MIVSLIYEATSLFGGMMRQGGGGPKVWSVQKQWCWRPLVDTWPTAGGLVVISSRNTSVNVTNKCVLSLHSGSDPALNDYKEHLFSSTRMLFCILTTEIVGCCLPTAFLLNLRIIHVKFKLHGEERS